MRKLIYTLIFNLFISWKLHAMAVLSMGKELPEYSEQEAGLDPKLVLMTCKSEYLALHRGLH
jgi:hypothetical protein